MNTSIQDYKFVVFPLTMLRLDMTRYYPEIHNEDHEEYIIEALPKYMKLVYPHIPIKCQANYEDGFTNGVALTSFEFDFDTVPNMQHVMKTLDVYSLLEFLGLKLRG